MAALSSSPFKLTLGLSLVLIAVLLCWWTFVPRLGEGVTKSGLLALRPGMTEAEVVRHIGKPLSKERIFGPHPIGEQPTWEGDWSWSYGEQLFLDFGPGFEISVNFYKGHLSHAAVERYDLGIWWCKEDECPIVWDKEEFSQLPGP